MRNNRALSKEVFSAVRLSIKRGGSAEECAKYFKISQNTYYRIRRCETWEEYRQMLAAIALAEKERKNNKAKAETEKIEETEKVANVEPAKCEAKVDPVPETKVTAANYLASNYQVNRLVEEMRLQNEYLKQISAKLAFIVESLA